VVIEAGMHGVPVVSYDTGGIREVVVQGETVILAPADDRRALAVSLGRALRDVELRARVGSAAQSRCSSAFYIRVDPSELSQGVRRVARERAVVALPSDRA
jgi:glycosyltransferase involved in cell wall biosynthesis